MKKLLVILAVILMVGTSFADTVSESAVSYDEATGTYKMTVTFVEADGADSVYTMTKLSSGYITTICTTPSASVTDQYDLYLELTSNDIDSDILNGELANRDGTAQECVRFSNPPQLDYTKTYYLDFDNNVQAGGTSTIDFYWWPVDKEN